MTTTRSATAATRWWVTALRSRSRTPASQHHVLMSSVCADIIVPMGAPAVGDRVDVEVAARLFRGLSDPTRLSILLALLDGERRVSDIVTAVGSSQSNVSNHLACLKGCGLVVDRPGDRRQVFYSIARPEVRDVLVASQHLLIEAGHRVQLCESPYVGNGRIADG